MNNEKNFKQDSKIRQTEQFVCNILEKINKEKDSLAAIFLGEWLATFLWINYCGIYRLDDIEEILLSKIEFQVLEQRRARKKEIHIASSIYKSGGHTPLMRLLVTHSENRPDILLTRACDRHESLDILKIEDSKLHTVKGHTYLDRIHEIAQAINGYENVVLHIHPNDIVCSIALHLAKRANANLHIAFLNHADHSFSVGLGIADTVLEISTYGWNLRHQKGLMEKSSFIGLPIEQKNITEPHARSMSLILTGGTSYKFKPIGVHSLPKVLDLLLRNEPNLKLLVVGPDRRDYWWWPLLFKYYKRVIIKKLVSRDEYLKLLDTCRIYVDSYPVTGGTAFPEALMRGCDIAGLKGSTWGSNFADNLRSSSTSEFIDICGALIAGRKDVLALQQFTRLKCIEFHAPKAVLARIEFTRSQKLLLQPPDGFVKEVPPKSFEIAWSGMDKPHLPRLNFYRRSELFKHIASSLIMIFGVTSLPVIIFLVRAALSSSPKR